MSDERREVTDAEFERFSDACRYWIEYYGLIDWNVSIFKRSLTDDEPEVSQTMANVSANDDSREVIISFTDEYWSYALTPKGIEETAYHEVCEILMMELWFAAISRFDTSYDDMVAASHGVIHRLTNTTFKEYWDAKGITNTNIFNVPEGDLPWKIVI